MPEHSLRNTLSANRLISLDALRGFTMFWLVSGSKIMRSLPKLSDNALFRELALQFEHVEWIGLRFYDLIFPLFIFIVGVTLPFAFGKRLEKGARRIDLYRQKIFIKI